MIDICDLVDYAQDDCVFDIYNCVGDTMVAKGLTRQQLRKWCDFHVYELISFEPIQRPSIFGIQFNVK